MTERVKKANELIQKEISGVLLKELDISPHILLTISRVDTSPDFLHAKVYFTVFPENEEEGAAKELENRTYDIQKALNRKLKMRQVPKIEFRLDKQAKAEQKVFELLNEDE